MPVVLVSSGAGIAPMRAILQERAWQRGQAGAGAGAGGAVGDTVMFFGCRRRDEDYLYSDELQAYCRDGTLTALHTAFSREQVAKVYVQHRVAEQGALVWELLRARGAWLYVCGGMGMGRSVGEALEGVAAAEGKLPAARAKEWIKKLTADGRYIQELWSS